MILPSRRDVGGLYVVETDAECKRCGECHGIVTSGCMARIFVDYATARWIAKHIEGSAVREIEDIPNVPHVLDIHQGGRRDRRFPALSGRLG